MAGAPRRPEALQPPIDDSESRPPLLPWLLLLVLLAVTTGLLVASLGVRESSATLVRYNPIGWLVAVAAIVAFAWFRAANSAAAASRRYEIPKWNPPLWASGMAVAAWLVSVAHAYFIAEALARR